MSAVELSLQRVSICRFFLLKISSIDFSEWGYGNNVFFLAEAESKLEMGTGAFVPETRAILGKK